MGRAADRDRRILLAGLTLLLAFVYWACVRRYLVYDGEMMFRVTQSLVVHHSFRIQDPVLHLNEPYSFYGLAVSLLLMPLYLLGQLLTGDGRTLITTFEPIVTALTVAALLSLLVELGISWQRALAVALLYAFASLAWAYSGVLYSEPLVGLCLVSGVLFLVRYERVRSDPPLYPRPASGGRENVGPPGGRGYLLLAGGAAGLALLARLDSALLVVMPLTGYLGFSLLRPRPNPDARSRDWARIVKPLLVFGSPIVAATAINVAYDMLRYGGPLPSGYLGTAHFSTPLYIGVFGLLFSPGAGLLVYIPVLLLAVAGARSLWRSWPRVAVLICCLFLLRLGLYGQWFGWDGGIAFGPRYLVPIVPLLFVPIAFTRRRYVITTLLVAMGGLSLGVELLNQVVPFGQYYTTVAATLDAAARRSCPGCPLAQIVTLTTGPLDYDWRYLPLHGQFAMLVAGRVDPIWRSIAPAVPILTGIVGLVLWRLCRIAQRLDRKPGNGRVLAEAS